ncbi:MAG: hypothetical protein WC091_26075 [Sulfuricellaceae bacterium]
MNTMEKIIEQVHTLPETDALKVLDFVGYLKASVPKPRRKLRT